MNYKPYLVLSLFIMMADKLLCTVKRPVVMNTEHVGGWTLP